MAPGCGSKGPWRRASLCCPGFRTGGHARAHTQRQPAARGRGGRHPRGTDPLMRKHGLRSKEPGKQGGESGDPREAQLC